MPAGRAGSEDFSHAPPWRQYLAALYFTITTLSTTGFGDIVAQNSLEQARASSLVLTLCRADRGGALRCRLLARVRALAWAVECNSGWQTVWQPWAWLDPPASSACMPRQVCSAWQSGPACSVHVHRSICFRDAL